jgi:hypothetical protein
METYRQVQFRHLQGKRANRARSVASAPDQADQQPQRIDGPHANGQCQPGMLENGTTRFSSCVMITPQPQCAQAS